MGFVKHLSSLYFQNKMTKHLHTEFSTSYSSYYFTQNSHHISNKQTLKRKSFFVSDLTKELTKHYFYTGKIIVEWMQTSMGINEIKHDICLYIPIALHLSLYTYRSSLGKLQMKLINSLQDLLSLLQSKTYIFVH